MIKNYEVKAKLVAYTQPTEEFRDAEISDLQDLIAFCAKVSNPSGQYNMQTTEKLLGYLAKNSHWSPFEMVHATIELTTTRDIARQLLRHGSMKFQEYCISGDTLITTLTKCGRTNKVSIESLYNRFQSKQYWNMSDNLVRVYDEKSKKLISAKIKEVFETGIKDVYEITLENGKKIKSTPEHKFLTNNGFLDLSKINEESFVACNGIPVYQDYNWMKSAKSESIESGFGLQYIADKANISYHTVRKWLKRLNLQFTKKEVASYTEAWNKNLPKELQPNFGKFCSESTRDLMSISAKSGANSNLYKNGKYTKENISWRSFVANKCKGFHTELLIKQNFKCAISGEEININDSEVDHIFPVYSNPELAFDINNLQILSKKSHKPKSIKESLESKYTVKYSKVKSIEYVGKVETFDMEIEHESHNYVANGIVTHNSQRYANPVVDLNFYLREARLQDTKNRQNSFATDDTLLQDEWNTYQTKVIETSMEAYNWAISKGIAKEQARVVLPEGNTESKLYVAGSIRSFIHYIQLRSGNGTQNDHIVLAIEIAKAISAIYKDINNYVTKVE